MYWSKVWLLPNVGGLGSINKEEKPKEDRSSCEDGENDWATNS